MKNKLFIKSIDIGNGIDQNSSVGGELPVSRTEQQPDMGYNYYDIRLYIEDLGVENSRNPEWVDFTELENQERLKSFPDQLQIGSETAVPFVFKASSLSINLNNSDFIFDNLRKTKLITIFNNDANFNLNTEETNYDLRGRHAKLVGRTAANEMTTEYDLGHYEVKSIETNSDGTAKINLDSPEVAFMDTQANKVKDGRNWYFDRSVSFLAKELIKSVRRAYYDGKEQIPDGDIISVANVESPNASTDETDSSRVFSEYGRPIAEIAYTDNTIAGEKRLIVTAATPRNIFKTTLQESISIGSNYIKIRIDDNIWLRKGDVITIGKESAADWSLLDEEKLTVLEDIEFSYYYSVDNTRTDNIKNVKVSSITKDHNLSEGNILVERWIIYLGVTRTIESNRKNTDTDIYSENYILAFDPDRDETANLTNLTNSGTGLGVLRHQLRFLGFKQVLKTPTTLNPSFGIPTCSKLIGVGCNHTFPGKPSEDGNFIAWTVNNTCDWNDNTNHLTQSSEITTLAAELSGGIYTGEMCFRAMSALADNSYMYVDDPNSTELPTEMYGAKGLGQFVPETESRKYENGAFTFPSHNFTAYNLFGRFKGYGYFAGLASDIVGDVENPEDEIIVYAPTSDNGNIMGLQGNRLDSDKNIITGTIYIIGTEASTDKDIYNSEENFYYTAQTKSDKILFGYKEVIDASTGYSTGRFIYKLQNGIDANFNKNNTVILIVPDTGKMYVKNCGENLTIPEPQVINFIGYDKSLNNGTDESTVVLTDDDFNDTIKLEKKPEIDGKKTTTTIEKKLIDTTAIDKGYYNATIEKSKLIIKKGDIINEETGKYLFQSAANNIRVIPSQYTCKPFLDSDIMETIDDSTGAFVSNGKGFGIPIYNGYGEILEGSLDVKPTPTANNHIWNMPVIGLWVKYDQVDNTMSAFDDAAISENGNSEMLGYWYLDYAEDYATKFDHGEYFSMGYPLIDLAICDKNGMVITNSLARKDDFAAYFNADHLPLSTVIHNVWDKPKTVFGALTYEYGQANNEGYAPDRFQASIVNLFGGSWVTKETTYNGETIDITAWEPGAEFINTFPCTKWKYDGYGHNEDMYIIWKFKKLKDTQADGSLFISPICNPVRPNHIHIPYQDVGGEVNAYSNFASSIAIKQDMATEASDFSGIACVGDCLRNSITHNIIITSDLTSLVSQGKFYYTDQYNNSLIGLIVTITGIPNKSWPINGKVLSASRTNIYSSDINIFHYAVQVDIDYDLYIAPVAPVDISTWTWSVEENQFNAYNTDTNFEDGCEERYNYLNQAEDNALNRILWVADRFSHSKILGAVYGYGKSRSGGGFLGGLTITDINDSISRSVNIPLGYYYGRTNLLKFRISIGGTSTGIDLPTDIEVGDKYMIYGSLESDGYFTVHAIINSSPYSYLVLKWSAMGETYNLPNMVNKYLHRLESTKLTENMTHYEDYVLLQDGVEITYATLNTGSNKYIYINRNGSEVPLYLSEQIEHKDIKPGTPVGVEADRLILNLYKINFNTNPTLFGSVNYPRALYAKTLHKFWYYNRRVTRGYIGGDGTYDSNIMPTSWGDKFFDSAAKYYLSRKDNTYTNINNIVFNDLNCDCYTPNYNSAGLGDEDNLYSIVHINYQNTGFDIYPSVKFNMGHQKNFQLDSSNSDIIYFSQRNFRLNSSGKLYIDSVLKQYDYNAGSPVISEIANFPRNFVKSDLDITEASGFSNIFPDISENITGTQSNTIDENPDTTLATFQMMGDFEIHGIFKSSALYPYCGIMNWKNYGMVDINTFFEGRNINGNLNINKPPISIKYFVNPLVTYEGFSQQYLTIRDSDVWSLKTFTDKASTSKIKLISDINETDADMFIIKGWVEEKESHNYTVGNFLSIKGIVGRRHYMFSDNESERNMRDFSCAFAISPNTIVDEKIYYIDIFSASASSHMLTGIKKFTFTNVNTLGYFYADTYDNSLQNWNGSTDNSTVIGALSIVGDAQPCVEGDFNQYEGMIKIDSPYQEVFGFSSGPRIHLASASLKGGRNIIWKLSKSLAFHIAVADFENLSVWDALSQLAELTNSLLSFDRQGKLHFESRPSVSNTSPYAYTVDKIEEGNLISINKTSAFDKIYNHIEMIPYKPVLPKPAIDLSTSSDVNSITANNDLFITDMNIEVVETDKNKSRPLIKAYQKDFERKKILLICNDAQFDTGNIEGRGIYSRWKYAIINDIVELRLTQKAIYSDPQYIYVNQIPFDNVSGELLIKKGAYLYIGNNQEYQVSDTDDYVDVINKKIKLTTSIPVQISYDIGLPVKVLDFQDGINTFHATGSGAFSGRLTYSPHGFFSEIGEWFFDDRQLRLPAKLLKDINLGDTYIYIDDMSNMDQKGYISIDGDKILYQIQIGNKIKLISGLKSSHTAGSVVYKLPTPPKFGDTTNDLYAPDEYRLGGYDEIGPSCKNDYHLYDPDEDGITYYDDDPLLGGKPITALEFYWEGQKPIRYTDDNGNTISNYIFSSTGHMIPITNRNRTFACMSIDFNSFKFMDGDKIDLDFPGIKLEQQTHLKKTFSDYESIQVNGMKPYPNTDNRFFNSKTAAIVGQRILNSLSNIGNNIEIVAKLTDIKDMDFSKIIKVIDADLFQGNGNSVIGYINNISISLSKKTATINALVNKS